MKDLDYALKQKNFKWLPKHLNHIAENIVFKNRNISFLAINALFRTKDLFVKPSAGVFTESYEAEAFLPVQRNDLLRKRAEILTVVFRLDENNNIIPITAISENDEY
jgi:hypothetical protein